VKHQAALKARQKSGARRFKRGLDFHVGKHSVLVNVDLVPVPTPLTLEVLWTGESVLCREFLWMGHKNTRNFFKRGWGWNNLRLKPYLVSTGSKLDDIIWIATEIWIV
jgi:hypothetical protein